MKVLVTGASGHVGANLVRELLHRGDHVRALIHESEIGLDGLDIERVRGDVCDADAMQQAVRGVEVVYHLAAIISISGDHGGKVSRINVEGPRTVGRAALQAGVRRMVHCCSIHAFNQAPRDETLDETRSRVNDTRHPAYDRSKAAGEAEVRKLVAEGLDAVIMHPTAIIGPHDYRPSRVGRVFLDLYHRRLPSLVPGGFNWVDVRDVVGGLIAAAEHGRSNESYLLSGHWHSVQDLADIAQAVTGVRPPRITSPMWLAQIGAPFVEAYGWLTRHEPLYTRESLLALRANSHIVCTKAQHELGYAPRPTEETVRDIYAFLDGAGMLRPSLRAS